MEPRDYSEDLKVLLAGLAATQRYDLRVKAFLEKYGVTLGDSLVYLDILNPDELLPDLQADPGAYALRLQERYNQLTGELSRLAQLFPPLLRFSAESGIDIPNISVTFSIHFPSILDSFLKRMPKENKAEHNRKLLSTATDEKNATAPVLDLNALDLEELGAMKISVDPPAQL